MLEEDGGGDPERNGRGWKDTPAQLQATWGRKEEEKIEGEKIEKGGRV